jgi:hypothetical protein
VVWEFTNITDYDEGRKEIMIITHADARGIRFCNRGMRAFFERHKLDWTTFIKEGLPEEEILATGDAMAEEVVYQAHKRAEQEQLNGRS